MSFPCKQLQPTQASIINPCLSQHQPNFLQNPPILSPLIIRIVLDYVRSYIPSIHILPASIPGAHTFPVYRLKAVRRAVGNDALLSATAPGRQHPDAKLAHLGVVAAAAVGAVAACAALEDGALDLGGGISDRGGRGEGGNAVDSGEEDGGELHGDDWVGWALGEAEDCLKSGGWMWKWLLMSVVRNSLGGRGGGYLCEVSSDENGGLGHFNFNVLRSVMRWSARDIGDRITGKAHHPVLLPTSIWNDLCR